MQRSTSHLHGSISLPTSPKLLSDPYKYDYQRRRTKSTKSSTACPDAASPPSAKRLERLVSELENIRLSEVRSLESFFEFPVFAISVFRPTVAISSFDISFFCVLEICVEFCAINPTSYSQTNIERIRILRPERFQARCPHGFTRFTASPRDFKRCIPGFKHACPHVHAQARCPHGFTRFTASPRDFKRSLHGSKPVCPHGYSQAACAIHAPAQTTPARLPRYEDSIFAKTAKLFM
ncbi:hypothetical protein DFH06DRAFT_1343730 [Mycena polygramma]|nr:hypothetical protein DFH06DRAFT_1343730 [Mycena polygramma]